MRKVILLLVLLFNIIYAETTPCGGTCQEGEVWQIVSTNNYLEHLDGRCQGENGTVMYTGSRAHYPSDPYVPIKPRADKYCYSSTHLMIRNSKPIYDVCPPRYLKNPYGSDVIYHYHQLNIQEDIYRCLPCDQHDTPFPPEDDNNTYSAPWKVDDANASNNRSKCTENNGTVEDALLTCVEFERCKTLIEDENCTEPPRDFPPEALNETASFYWSPPEDRSSECTDKKGNIQSARVECKDKYRCVTKTDAPPLECPVPIASYVSPRDGVFHEDIAVDGVDFGLHYSSAILDDTTIAYGWSISTHALLAEDRLYLGNGTILAIERPAPEDNLTIIPVGSKELLFDSSDRHIATRDLYSKQTLLSFAYDSSDRLITITDSYNQTTTIQRDSSGVITSIVAPTGQTTYLSIDSSSDLTEVQYTDTSSYSFIYDKHLMTKEIEPKGNEFLHIFDDKGKVVKVIDAEQGNWEFGSMADSTLTTTQIIKASGDILSYKKYPLTDNGMLKTQKILPTGDIITIDRAIDDTLEIVNSCGMKTESIYKKVDNKLYKDIFTHKRVLESSEVATPSGLKKLTQYNTRYIYDANGSLERKYNIQKINGKAFVNGKYYTGHRREVRNTPERQNSWVAYDETLQLPLEVKPYGLVKTYYSYDTQGRVTQKQTHNRITLYTYDAKGNLATITDPLGRITKYSYDSRDRLSTITYPDEHTLHYSYDANGNMTTLITPTPTDHTFEYNGVNKRTNYTSPLQKATRYTYDKQRRVTNIAKPSGANIDFTYTNGRLAQVATPEGSTEYNYYCQSNPSSITKDSESIGFEYDGTLLTKLTYQGLLNQSLSYTYNNDFIPDSFSYADKTVAYLYNRDNELIESGDYNITKETYGRKILVSDSNHTQMTFYNALGELREQSDSVYRFKLWRNKLGQIIKRVETIDANISTTLYRYDERNRLIRVNTNGKLIEVYRYDANGNREFARVDGNATYAHYTLDDQLEVYGNDTYRYNDDGYLIEKMTADGTTTYDYGSMGELQEVVTPSNTITYQHNANNQRVAKLVDGEIVEKYLWANLTTLLAIYDKDDNLIQRFDYVNSRMPISMMQNNQKYYLHYDQVGSLRAISRVLSPDNTNLAIVKEITYDTFGNILSDSNPSLKVPFGFAGGLYDQDTKLTRFGYRDYDAYTGKWTAKDPIGFDGGDSNLYGYVLGDPVSGIDPLGLYDDPRLRDRGVPRGLGGDGGINDSDASRNGTILTPFLGAIGLSASITILGTIKTIEIATVCIVNGMGVSDGISGTDKARSGRQRGAVTREQLERKKRTDGGRYIRIKGVKIWIPW